MVLMFDEMYLHECEEYCDKGIIGNGNNNKQKISTASVRKDNVVSFKKQERET